MGRVSDFFERIGIIADYPKDENGMEIQPNYDDIDGDDDIEAQLEAQLDEMLNTSEAALFAIWQAGHLCPRCYVSALVHRLQRRLDANEIQHFTGDPKGWVHERH